MIPGPESFLVAPKFGAHEPQMFPGPEVWSVGAFVQPEAHYIRPSTTWVLDRDNRAIYFTLKKKKKQGHILGRPINPMWTFLLEKKIDFLAINRTRDLKHMVQMTSQATVWVIDEGLFPKYNILFNGYNKKYMSNFLRWGPN